MSGRVAVRRVDDGLVEKLDGLQCPELRLPEGREKAKEICAGKEIFIDLTSAQTLYKI